MDRLYGYYTVHISSLNEHAAKMPARYGGSENLWRLRVQTRAEFEANLRTPSRNPRVKVAWLQRILLRANDSVRKSILEGLLDSVDEQSSSLLAQSLRHAA